MVAAAAAATVCRGYLQSTAVPAPACPPAAPTLTSAPPADPAAAAIYPACSVAI